MSRRRSSHCSHSHRCYFITPVLYLRDPPKFLSGEQKLQVFDMEKQMASVATRPRNASIIQWYSPWRPQLVQQISDRPTCSISSASGERATVTLRRVPSSALCSTSFELLSIAQRLRDQRRRNVAAGVDKFTLLCRRAFLRLMQIPKWLANCCSCIQYSLIDHAFSPLFMPHRMHSIEQSVPTRVLRWCSLPVCLPEPVEMSFLGRLVCDQGTDGVSSCSTNGEILRGT